MTNETKTAGPDLAEIDAVIADMRKGVAEQLDCFLGNLRAVMTELAELRAFAERFPKTADGVRIVPGIELWVEDADKARVVSCVAIDLTDEQNVWFVEDAIPSLPSDCYSTEAAMLAAKEGK